MSLEEHAQQNQITFLQEDLKSVSTAFDNGYIDYDEFREEKDLIEQKLSTIQNE